MDAAAGAIGSGRPASRAANWLRRVSPVQMVCALVAAAIAVRAAGISLRPLWLDEAYSAWFSAQSWRDLWTIVPTYEPHPPLYYSLLKIWRGLFGDGLGALRSLPLLFSVLAIPVAYAAAIEAERLAPTGRGRLRAGTAALLVAMSPLLVWLGAETRPYPMLIFGYAVAILGVLRLAREFEDRGAGSWAAWAILGAGTELTLWSHGLGVLYAFCLGLAVLPWAVVRPGSRDRWLKMVATGLVAGLLYLPCLLLITARSGDWGTGWLHWDPNMIWQLIGLYSVPRESLGIVAFPVAVILLLLAKRAIAPAIGGGVSWSCDRTILLLWLGPPALAIAISMAFMPVFLMRTLAPTLVPAFLAMATALARTKAERERQLLVGVLSVGLTITAVQISLRPPAEPWNEASSYLARNVSPGDEIWLYPNDSALPLGDAARRQDQHYRVRPLPAAFPALGVDGPIRAGSPAVVSLTDAKADALVADPNLREVKTIWLVSRQEDVFDPDRSLRSALTRVRTPGVARDWAYISVQPYRLPARAVAH
ncbi:MAG TPA: glycosyltransferase family 39 protein [Sphingomicrobium sp.]|nr:glycosyltransferase family 39 protein [Sphingomicrobium sp.]